VKGGGGYALEVSCMQYQTHVQTGMQVLDTACETVMMNVNLGLLVNMSTPNTPIVQCGASVCTNVAALQFRRKSARGSRPGKCAAPSSSHPTIFSYFPHRCQLIVFGP